MSGKMLATGRENLIVDWPQNGAQEATPWTFRHVFWAGTNITGVPGLGNGSDGWSAGREGPDFSRDPRGDNPTPSLPGPDFKGIPSSLDHVSAHEDGPSWYFRSFPLGLDVV
jgi:hypothetical protein